MLTFVRNVWNFLVIDLMNNMNYVEYLIDCARIGDFCWKGLDLMGLMCNI